MVSTQSVETGVDIDCDVGIRADAPLDSIEQVVGRVNRNKRTGIDQRIVIDFVKKKDSIELHEVKKSVALEKAHYWQLMYYLYYLEKFKGIENAKGVINYPKQRKVSKVFLSEKKEKELEEMLVKIKEIVLMPVPPEKKKSGHCRKCSYFEFCWTE